jgi:YidC/Oxa1 family membrane protein insertase
MKDLGLDFGWGPTSIMQYLVEHIHVYAQTPWWCTIAVSAIAMRLLLAYPSLRAADMQGKLAKIHPEVQAHMKAMQDAQVEGDKLGVQVASHKLRAIKKRNGISTTWMLAPVPFQMVMGFGAFKLTRAMAALPVPGFESGGLLWIKDLTIADPTYITPAVMAGMMVVLARVRPSSPLIFLKYSLFSHLIQAHLY